VTVRSVLRVTPTPMMRGPLAHVVRAAGYMALGLGLFGLALPVMPTMPFLVIAAACLARTDPRLHARLLNHRLFGPPLRDWLAHRSLPLRTKVLAGGGIALAGATSLLLWVPEGPLWWVSAGVVGAMLLGVLLIPTRRAA